MVIFPPPKTLTPVLLVPYFAQTRKSRDTRLGFRYIVGVRRISDCCQSLEDMLRFRTDHMRRLFITCCISAKSDGGNSSQAACSFIFVSSGSETCQSLGIVVQRIAEFPLCCCQFAAWLACHRHPQVTGILFCRLVQLKAEGLGTCEVTLGYPHTYR